MPDNKEQEPLVSREQEQGQRVEHTPDPESSSEREHPLEAESVIEKIERRRKGSSDATDDTNVVVPQSDDQPAVTLPVSKSDVSMVSKIPVVSSLRWLVEWAIRQIKKFGGRVKYHEPDRKDS